MCGDRTACDLRDGGGCPAAGSLMGPADGCGRGCWGILLCVGKMVSPRFHKFVDFIL